jgi:hypothetical protein
LLTYLQVEKMSRLFELIELIESINIR